MRVLRSMIRTGRVGTFGTDWRVGIASGVPYPAIETESLGGVYAFGKFFVFFAQRGSAKVGRLFSSADGINFSIVTAELYNVLDVTVSIDGGALIFSVTHKNASTEATEYKIYKTTDGVNFSTFLVSYGSISQHNGLAFSSAYGPMYSTANVSAYTGWASNGGSRYRFDPWTNDGLTYWICKNATGSGYWANIAGMSDVCTSDNPAETPHQYLPRGPLNCSSLLFVNGYFYAFNRQTVSGSTQWVLRTASILPDSLTEADWGLILLPLGLANFYTGNHVDWDIQYSLGKYLIRGTVWAPYTPYSIYAMSDDGINFTEFTPPMPLPTVRNMRQVLEAGSFQAAYYRFTEQPTIAYPSGFAIFGTQKEVYFTP